MKKYAFSIILFLSSSVIAAESSYICIADKAAGFSFDNATGNWESGNFKADQKYLVKKSSANGYSWEVKHIGEVAAILFCKEDFNEAGALFCEGMSEFRMNKNTGRFLVAYMFGYWTDDKVKSGKTLKEGENTPFMEIGKCSPL